MSADGLIAFPMRLADGRVVDAGDLRLGQLWAEMKRLGVPGITAEMGKYDLLRIYGDQRNSRIAPGEPSYLTQAVIENGGKWIGEKI